MRPVTTSYQRIGIDRYHANTSERIPDRNAVQKSRFSITD